MWGLGFDLSFIYLDVIVLKMRKAALSSVCLKIVGIERRLILCQKCRALKNQSLKRCLLISSVSLETAQLAIVIAILRLVPLGIFLSSWIFPTSLCVCGENCVEYLTCVSTLHQKVLKGKYLVT